MATDSISISAADGIWVVRAEGAILGESEAALELQEDGRMPVVYFPRSDIAMEFLEASATEATSPRMGTVSYFGIAGESGLIPDAAWCFEAPPDRLTAIAGHIAFDCDKVVVEQV